MSNRVAYRRGENDAFAHRAEVLERVATQQAQLAPHAYELLEAVKMAYRKHHMGDENVGWEELGDTLHNALCNAMGDEGYQRWIEKQN